jgi:hypothetical protein
MTGPLITPLGSDSVPSITFTGDTNTGIYSPGADQVAISTNGTGRLFVDASGRLSLGASSTDRTAEFYTASGNNGLRISNGADSAADFAVFDLVQNASQKFALYTNQNNTTANANTGAFIFQTGAAERMRLDSSGRLGLGTSSPNTLLHVFGGDLKVQKSSISLNDISEITLSNVYRTGRILSSYTDPANTAETYIAFHTNRAGQANDTVGEAMRIAGGNVGIGTSSPQNLLSTGSGASGQLGLSIDWTGGGGPYQVAGLTADHGTGEIRHFAFTNYYHTFYSNNSERARIDSSGRLLVGTSSDSGGALLQVNDNRIRIATANTPASAGATGTTGEIAWDADYIYVCTATNTWKRTAISTW